jgi:hypothetical protein
MVQLYVGYCRRISTQINTPKSCNVTQDKSQRFTIKYCKILIRETANMPRNNVRADSCYQKAVEYLVKNPNLTVQEGMILADFSPHEHEDKVKYMMVICLLNKTDKMRNGVFTTPPELSITVSMPSEPISSVTTMSTKESGPATTIPCSTSPAAQLHHIPAAKKKREYNTAFKHATLMYA